MQHLLWKSRHVFEARQEKCAAALVAVAEELATDAETLGPAEREFLRLFDACAELDPHAFTQVWRDPTAYAWTLTAFDLLAAGRTQAQPSDRARAVRSATGRPTPLEALGAHLQGFARFALAAHVLAGQSCRLEQPLRADLPLALPGTRLSLRGTGGVEIDAFEKGRLRGRTGATPFDLDLADPAPGGPLELARCPVIEDQGCALRLQAEAFHDLQGFAEFEVVCEAGDSFQRSHRGAVATALGVVARHAPDSFAQIRDELGLLGLKPPEAGDFANQSHSDLPGAAVLSFCPEPYDLAETLVHELHHNRLFALEERGGFFEAETTDVGDTLFYSPWRTDPRPLLGLFHGFYVYVAVARFWLGVSGADVPERIAAYARSRLACVALQLRLAEHQLEGHGELSAFGRDCFDGIAAAAREIAETARGRGIDPEEPSRRCTREGEIIPETADGGAPVSTREDVRRHVEAHAPESQRADLVGALEAAGR